MYLITSLPGSIQGVLSGPWVFWWRRLCLYPWPLCIPVQTGTEFQGPRLSPGRGRGRLQGTWPLIWAVKPRVVRAMQGSMPRGASSDHGFTAPRSSFMPKVYRVNYFSAVTYSIIYGRSLNDLGLLCINSHCTQIQWSISNLKRWISIDNELKLCYGKVIWKQREITSGSDSVSFPTG